MGLGDPWDNTAPVATPLAWFAAVVATTNLTISTGIVPGQVIDGYTLVAGDIVLLVGQSTASQNGLYISAATPVRHPSFDENAELGAGIAVTIRNGSVGANKEYELRTPAPITVGATALTFDLVTPVAAATLPTTVGPAFDNTAPVGETLTSQPFDNTAPVRLLPSKSDGFFGATFKTIVWTNINLALTNISGTTIGGAVIADNDVVALAGQADPTQNGFWQIRAAGLVPIRATFLDSNLEADSGVSGTPVAGPDVGKNYLLEAESFPIVLGVTRLSFGEKFTQARSL